MADPEKLSAEFNEHFAIALGLVLLPKYLAGIVAHP